MRSSLVGVVVALSLGLLPRCMRVTDGIEVDVAYQPAVTPSRIGTDAGYQVALERALIAIGEVELVRCDDPVVDVGMWFGPSRARAHVLDTPTSLGVPVVIDLMESAGVPIFAGTLKPPPGRYCGVRALGMPADDDAVGLTEDSLEMTGHTVIATGRIVDAESAVEIDLLVRVPQTLVFETRFERPLVFDGPTLRRVVIRIDHTRWFDGIDFARQPQDAVHEQITSNVRSSWHGRPSEWEGP